MFLKRLKKRKREKQLRRTLDRLRIEMQNYPEGTITDIVGANLIYDLINRAATLARLNGYKEEEIKQMIAACKEAPEPAPYTDAEFEDTNTNN